MLNMICNNTFSSNLAYKKQSIRTPFVNSLNPVRSFSSRTVSRPAPSVRLKKALKYPKEASANFSNTVSIYSPKNDKMSTVVNCNDGLNADSTKAIARVCPNPKDVEDYFSDKKASVKDTLERHLQEGVEDGVSPEEMEN